MPMVTAKFKVLSTAPMVKWSRTQALESMSLPGLGDLGHEASVSPFAKWRC